MLVDDLVLHPHTAMAWSHAPRLYRESALRETASASPDPYLPAPAPTADSPLVSLPSSQPHTSPLYAPLSSDGFLGRSPATPFTTLFASSPAGFWRTADYSVSPVVRHDPAPHDSHDADAPEWYVCKCLIDLGHAPKASPGIARLRRTHAPSSSSLSSLSSAPSSPSEGSSHIPARAPPARAPAASSRARALQAPARSRLRTVHTHALAESDNEGEESEDESRTRAQRLAHRPGTRASTAARHAPHTRAPPKPRLRAHARLAHSDETASEAETDEDDRAHDTRSRKRRAPERAPLPRAKRTRTASASAGEDDRRAAKGKSQGQGQQAPQPAEPVVYATRTFPADVSIDAQFPLFYRRFHVSSFPREDGSTAPGLSDAAYNPPADSLNLYTPRFVKGKGTSKVGLCPCCFEAPARGGEGTKLWLSMKFSAFNYHMQFSHGISAMTGRPFSPPVAFRTVARTEVGKHEKARIMQGRCHRCREWVPVEGIKNVPVKVKEIFWWKHAASCHQGSTIDGERDVYVEDDVYHARLAEASPDDSADQLGGAAEGEDLDADADADADAEGEDA